MSSTGPIGPSGSGLTLITIGAVTVPEPAELFRLNAKLSYSCEFVVSSVHPGFGREQIVENTGWAVRFAENVAETPVPTRDELDALRALKARTEAAHRTAGKGEAAE